MLSKIINRFKLLTRNKTGMASNIEVARKLESCKVSNTFSHEDFFSITYESANFILQIEENVKFRKYCHILMYTQSQLILHNNVFFNNYCSINCLGKIEIGEGTIFGEAVKLYDHNHAYKFNEGVLNIERNNFKIGHITIGKNCWIGSNVTILNNVEIGDNVIIGANCLVYKSIPSNSIVKLKQELTIEQK